MVHKITKRSEALIRVQEIEGKKYALMDTRADGTEIWVTGFDIKPEDNCCTQCGYSGAALQEHHIYGRKNSNETILLCANCHNEVHAGTRVLK